MKSVAWLRLSVLAAVCAFLTLLNHHLPVLGDPGDDEVVADTDTAQIQKFSNEELRELVAPVALYPDALLSQVLQASAYPEQLGDAFRYWQGSKSATPPDSVSWDPSVVALLNYPTVLERLNADPDWTEKLGVAVTYQMSDVSDTIQQVRAEAQAAGNLVSTPQQTVAQDGDAITIAPAQTDVIYVPTYDPTVIFVRNPRPIITFGIGFRFGVWLENRWDWHAHRFWRYESWRPGGWYRPARPVYWRAPPRRIPTWYRRGAVRSAPLQNQYRYGRAAPVRRVEPARPAVRPIRPVAPVVRREPERPVIRTPSHVEGFGATNQAIRREAQRGEQSRHPVVQRPVVRPEPRPAPQRTPPQNYLRPSDGRTAQREAERGAASRRKR